MINYGSVYLMVKDFEAAVDFYRALLEKDVSAQNMNRFAIFNVDGLCLSILNGYFDVQNPDKVVSKEIYCEEYDDYESIVESNNTGKVVINLATDNLKKEYERITSLGIGQKDTEIRYVNAGSPYYYFLMKDPDDNTIEITGPYDEEADGSIAVEVKMKFEGE